jgi:hypothetical protein
LPGCVKRVPAPLEPLPPAVCYTCLWVYQDPVYRGEIFSVYEGYRSRDPWVRAEVEYILGRMNGDAGRLCRAFDAFLGLRRSGRRHRRLHAAETLAFTAPECGRDPSPYFQRASRLAGKLGDAWKAGVYEALAAGSFQPTFGEATIERRLEVPDGTVAFVLGASAIRVEAGTVVGAQIERVVRDWLSYQMESDLSRAVASSDRLLWYHEGARLRDLLEAVPAKVLPLSGTLAARQGDRWLAPDEHGVFRFQVLPDKVRYPTTRASGNLALLVDTHGISSLVAAAVREDADLVVGCGDSTGKARAAFHLAKLGKDVYFPCDRYVDELLGYDAPGVLLGSAPLRQEGRLAIIGDRPISFGIDEVIVVQDASLRGRHQYYDAPARYFRRLAEALPLRIEWVEVENPGESGRVVRRAEETGATAIAVRVETEEDYGPVREWLAGSTARRAILFHTAAYPAGYRLFQEFPAQTTFGDPRPRFLTAGDAAP